MSSFSVPNPSKSSRTNDEIEIEVSHAALKPLSSVLNFLLRVGKVLVIEVERHAMTLRSLSDSRSAFAAVTFPESFFTSYSMELLPPKRSMCFKLGLRPLCTIMKNFRKVHSLVIRTDGNADARKGDELQILFEMESESGIRRIHKFSYQDADAINATFNERESSKLRVQAHTLHALLQHIHQNSPEVAMIAARNSFRVRSFHKDMSTSRLDASAASQMAAAVASGARHMTTEMNIGLEEFDVYDFRLSSTETELIFCVKEMRALLALCDVADIPDIDLYFSQGGTPVKVSCEREDMFTVDLVLATLPSAEDASEEGGENEAEEAHMSQEMSPSQSDGETLHKRKEPRRDSPPDGRYRLDSQPSPSPSGSRRDDSHGVIASGAPTQAAMSMMSSQESEPPQRRTRPVIGVRRTNIQEDDTEEDEKDGD